MPQQHGITTTQRHLLRQYASNTAPRPSQEQCIEWFFQTFQKRVSQATVSESLGQLYATLDTVTISLHSGRDPQRERQARGPEVESVLIEWQRAVEAQGGVTSQDLLRTRAQEIWS